MIMRKETMKMSIAMERCMVITVMIVEWSVVINVR